MNSMLGWGFPGRLVVWRNNVSTCAWTLGPSVLAQGPRVWSISGPWPDCPGVGSEPTGRWRWGWEVRVAAGHNGRAGAGAQSWGRDEDLGSWGGSARPALSLHPWVSDLKLHLQSTDYGNFLANEASPLTVSVIDDRLKEKMVVEFRHMRNHAYEPLASFLDFIT